jgi:hypothetical protein
MEPNSANWRTSTYSGPNGGQCVEVGNATWRTSTYSGPNGGSCVEVGNAVTWIVVRDTTNRAGAMLALPANAWRVLLAEVRADAQGLRPTTHTTR